MPFLALTAAVAIAAGAATTGAPSPYLLTWTGDAAAARPALTARLQPGALPDDGEGLLVLACLELEAGRLEVAERAAARLAAIEPRAGDGRVLAALVARRRASPREPMFDALAEAWKSSGRPNLGTGGALARLAGAAGSLPPAPGADLLARLTPEEAFLLGALDGPRRPVSVEAIRLAKEGTWLEARQEKARAFAARKPPRPVALDLAALGLLKGGREREQVRAALARALPDEGYFAVAAISGPPLDRGPLVATELAALEKALARPRLMPPRAPLHEALLATAARLDPRQAAAWAREALPTVTPRATALASLGARALATTEPALRARARRALERAAATLAREPTVDGRQLGVLLAKAAAELGGDAAKGKALLVRFEAWRQAATAAELALGEARWPLPSLRREWKPDLEVARAERLVGPVPP